MSETLEREPTRWRATAVHAWDQRLPLLLAAFALAVIVAVVLTLWLLLRAGTPGTNSPEAGFARDMSVHHAQAVEMALIAKERAEDPEIRIVATDIILTQQAQIGQTQGWLDAWGVPRNSGEPFMSWMGHPVDGRMPGMASADEVDELRELPPQELEGRFLQLMIPHHQAGVGIAERVLEMSDQPAVRRLAEAIATSQRAEIEMMQGLLARKGFAPVTTTVAMPEVEEHHGGGFVSSVPGTLRATLRFSPIAVVIFAVAWLSLEIISRQTGWHDVLETTLPAAEWWQIAAVVGLFGSGALHLGLTPDHFEESTAYGIFFVTAAVAGLFIAAMILTVPSPAAYISGVVIVLVLIAVYALFRVVPPPGAESVEDVDLIGLITKGMELVAGIASAFLWIHSRRAGTVQETGA